MSHTLSAAIGRAAQPRAFPPNIQETLEKALPEGTTAPDDEPATLGGRDQVGRVGFFGNTKIFAMYEWRQVSAEKLQLKGEHSFGPTWELAAFVGVYNQQEITRDAKEAAQKTLDALTRGGAVLYPPTQ